jgi:hypothetical protein
VSTAAWSLLPRLQGVAAGVEWLPVGVQHVDVNGSSVEVKLDQELVDDVRRVAEALLRAKEVLPQFQGWTLGRVRSALHMEIAAQWSTLKPAARPVPKSAVEPLRSHQVP